MKKNPIAVILSAPTATGKTRHASTIAAALGCKCIVDDWNGRDPLPAGALALTNSDYVAPPRGAVQLVADDADGVTRIVTALQQRAA